MAHAATESAAPALPRARLAGWFARAPFAAALLIAGFHLAVYFVYFVGFAQLDGAATAGQAFSEYIHWYPEIVLAVLIAFAVVVPSYNERSAVGHFDDLRPALTCSNAEFRALREELAQPRSGRARRVYLAAAVLFGVAINFYPGIWAEGAPPGIAHPELSWGLLRNGVLMGFLQRLIHINYDLQSAFTRVGREFANVDLLDLRPLAPFARRGLTGALVYVGVASLFALFGLGPWQTDWLIATLACYLAVSVWALVRPMRGVRHNIRAAKDAELDRVRRSIRRERSGLLDGEPPRGSSEARLADLLAYEARVDGVREWPFDASSLLRFALYLGIPLGSWLGGAIVERLLGAALD